MPLWAVLQFSFLLVVAIGVFAIILGELKMVERAEKAELAQVWAQFRENIASLR